MSEENNYPLLAVQTRYSIEWNIKYKMYFCPESRNDNQPFLYLGFYNGTKIQAMGRFENCITADYDRLRGKLGECKGENPVTESQKERLHKAFSDGEMPFDDGYSGHKFYLLDENDFTEIYDFNRTSGNRPRGRKYFILEDYFDGQEPQDDSSQAIAELLEGKTWS